MFDTNGARRLTSAVWALAPPPGTEKIARVHTILRRTHFGTTDTTHWGELFIMNQKCELCVIGPGPHDTHEWGPDPRLHLLGDIHFRALWNGDREPEAK